MKRELTSSLLTITLFFVLIVTLGYLIDTPTYILLSFALLFTLIAYASGFKLSSILAFNIVIVLTEWQEFSLGNTWAHIGYIAIVILSLAFTYFWEANKSEIPSMRLDELTGLPLRKGFQSHVEKRFKTQGDSLQAVLFLDIDNFKEVNDTYGHDVGDHTLENIAGVLKTVLREGDFISRWGGDEFVMFIESPGMTPDDVRHVVKRLFESLTKLKIEGVNKVITMSIGVAYRVTSEDTLEELIRIADMRMYKAKEKHKNIAFDGFEFFPDK